MSEQIVSHDFFRDEIFAIPGFAPRPSHAEIAKKYGVPEVYRMSSNESVYGVSPKVVEAIREAAPTLGFYPPMTDHLLRDAIAETVGRGMTRDNIFTGCSGYEALDLVLRAFLRPGDEVIISHPTFPVYDRLILLNNGIVVDVPLVGDEYALDIDGIHAAINERTRAIILCNPNNPIATIITAAEMDRLMQGVPPHVLVISDEVYFHFVESADFPDSIQYILDNRNVMVIHSFSKAYGLAGMRLGYAIAPPKFAEYVRQYHRGFHQNQLQLVAGIAALKDQEQLQKNVKAALDGKKEVCAALDACQIKYWHSETNFLAIDVGRSDAEVAEALLYHGVMVRPLTTNSMPGCIRVSMTLPEGNRKFVDGLITVLGLK